jgi:hypothetical protein
MENDAARTRRKLPYGFRWRKAMARLAKRYGGRINAAMTRPDKDHNRPRKPGSRDQRLAAALRENLRRRKAQERGRGTAAGADGPVKPAQAPDGKRIP